MNNLNIDYRVNFDFLKIRNKFKISSNSNEFEQDKNRYLISMTAPYVNLQLGDSYPYINQYVLNGYRVRGLNLKIDSKFFDAHIVQGELARSVLGDPADNSIIISNMYNNMICIDSNSQPTGDSTQELCCIDGCGEEYQNQWVEDDTSYIVDFSRDNYTFKRNIYAFNLGFGHPEYLFLNMNIVKAQDNINTLQKISNNMSGYIVEIPEHLVGDLININNSSSFNINIDSDIDFLGKEKLKQVKSDGIKKKLMGVKFDTDNIILTGSLDLTDQDNKIIGELRSACYSPHFKKVIGIAMMKKD